jgi:tellurite resistance protein
MGEKTRLPDDVAMLYAGALHAIARADGEITLDEGARLLSLMAARSSVEIDPEMLFFDQTTPESLGAALRAKPTERKAVGTALVEDAVALATCDGDLNGKEGRAILRFARALGCTAEEVHASTDQLDEWLSDLA